MKHLSHWLSQINIAPVCHCGRDKQLQDRYEHRAEVGVVTVSVWACEACNKEGK